MTSSRISKYSRSIRLLLNAVLLGSTMHLSSYAQMNCGAFAYEAWESLLASWKGHLQAHQMPDFGINAAALDAETGETWIGTVGAGLARYSGRHFVIYDQMNSGLAGNIVFDVEIFENEVWAATNGGLNVFNPIRDQWRLYNARTSKLPQLIFTELFRKNDSLCAFAEGGRGFLFHAQSDAFVPAGNNSDCFGPSTGPPATDPLSATEERQLPADRRPTIAIYGPRNRTISIPDAPSSTSAEAGRPELAAVEQAIEAANRRGGYRGETSFDLAMMQPGYANYAWGLPEDDLVSFERRAEVLGIVGFIAEGEHITEAVASRMDLPWVNVAPPEVAPRHGGNAGGMVFQCWGDEPRQHRAVFDYAMQRSAARQIGFIAGEGMEPDRHIRWWSDYALTRKMRGVLDYKLGGDQAKNREDLASLPTARLDVIFVWGDCETSVAVIEAVRRSSSSALIITGPQITDDCDTHDVDLQDVIAFLPSGEVTAGARRTAEASIRENVLFKAGAGSREIAVRTLDATEHLLHAIHAGGKSRPAVRRKLAGLGGSVFGEEHYEKEHAAAPVTIAEFRDGAWRRSTFRPGE